MTDLLADAPEPSPAELIRDAIDLMRSTWRVRGDYIIGSMLKERYRVREAGYGFCPVGAIAALAGDSFVGGRPLFRPPLARQTLMWIATHHRLPRCREERKKNRTNPRLAYARVAEWADSFTEAQDEELYAALEAAATAWPPQASVGGTANENRRRRA
ncbi:DUF6197 family protein [[Actinomadura] parvosata]|uniref:DUF6197 family protein n=1 Tax=[Actinomadura] parvosata TaxID=1955412 RepID=UPI00406C6A88